MEKTGGKFVLEWDTHSKQISKGLCMLMERQCLVDVAICCGSSTLHAHKCVLAASSTYFKEHFENKPIEQVVINGLDFAVIKSLVEFMYCGECSFAEEHLKYFIAAVKLFKITALESIFSESEYQHLAVDEVCIPPPQFICKPPKYPTVFKPFSNGPLPLKMNYPINNAFAQQHKFKRKCLGSDAEKACAKEAQASRVALANLRKVMASTPQVHSFIVEEAFNETTVENFIPSVEENYVEDIHEVQLVNGDLPQTSGKSVNIIPVSNSQGLTADKIKHILGNDDVEIMFQTSDGNFVNVSDEVLLNLSKGGLQYQVVDENGHIGEVQELKALDNETIVSKSTDEEKEEESFDLKIIKHSDDLDKITKDSNMETLQLHGGFNEDLYENNFHIQNTEIFEPENLSMHSDLMAENSIEFEAVNDLKYMPKLGMTKNDDSGIEIDKSENRDPLSNDSNEIVLMEADDSKKTALKFTPDMFFAELPDNAHIETNSETENN